MSTLNYTLPSNVGVNPESILNIVNILDECDCHSFMILRHNKIISQGWWKPYNPNYSHSLFSLSKSFVSTAICFAVQENLITFDDYIINFFPEYFPLPPSENMKKVQIKHLLMMSYGRPASLDPDFYYRKDWLEENLHVYLYHEPGTKFLYDNRCSYILSALLQKVTGKTVFEYLQPRLFKPLEIENIFWEEKNGYNMGRGGLNLKTVDLAKFGLFLKNKGQFNGKQLLRGDLVDEMTKYHIKTSDSNFTRSSAPDFMQGYGYFFWMCQNGGYRADGACSQFLVVMPKEDIVVAITAGTTTKGQVILQSLWDNLVDKLDEKSCISNEKEKVLQNQKILDDKLNSLNIRFLSSTVNFNSIDYQKFSGKIYKICQNGANVVKLSVVFGDVFDTLNLWALGNSKEPSDNSPKEAILLSLRVGHDEWVENDTKFETDNFHSHSTILFSDVACSSKWMSETEYAVKLVYTRTPYTDMIKINFLDNAIDGEYICYPVMANRGKSFQIMGVEIK
ncbi:hypothetical protein M9Y10_036427 [Tritrichomonas musculus]|uniref:Beta-lactamase-related domain-containing protein n=1 Tax=Tritrichomonas musculus TaxID=1915356 RepID=A0ABR2GMK6_9EUKA